MQKGKQFHHKTLAAENLAETEDVIFRRQQNKRRGMQSKQTFYVRFRSKFYGQNVHKVCNQRNAQQIIGREGETATFV